MKKIKRHKYSWIAVFAVMLLCLSGTGTVRAASFVEKHGELSVSGTHLTDENGKTVQLRGISTHGLAWFPQYVNKAAFKTMKNRWKVNTVRLALYTEEYGGYCTGDKQNQKKLEVLIDKGVSYAEELGMYVILDWHILSDGNPNTHLKEAKQFFKKMAEKYDGIPNVIFEICNEPNAGTSWEEIRAYAEKVLNVIRSGQKKSHALVIVGTPNWSQDVDIAAQSPLDDDKVVYALHFYAATHGSAYREKAQAAIDAELPLFVSEFGICDASGNGAVNKKEAGAWKKFLVRNKISLCAWNLSNKQETSALLKTDCGKVSGWGKKDLSESGKWVVKIYQKIS